MTSAAGLALAGMHPVVAIYATFLNRAFDQVLMDVALHRLPVTFVLDRAGVTGPDGASHNGMWDGSILQVVPGLKIAAPATAPGSPSCCVRRWRSTTGRPCCASPRGRPVATSRPWARWAAWTCCTTRPADQAPDVLLAGVGPMAGICVQAAGRLADQGIGVTVVDPRWLKPVDEALAAAARAHRLVVTVEDNGVVGGFGDAVCRLLARSRMWTPR